jgi:predicted dehydrogenase
MSRENRVLKVGVLGCGPIARAVHLDACVKARNVELHAVCDVADRLRERAVVVHRPKVAYREYDAMLADTKVDAVLVAVADAFHVPACLRALEAGKHVLVEKPLGTTVEECVALSDKATSTGLVVQVGHNRRFDPGVAFARKFVREEMGRLQALTAWYHDSVHRYTMTDNLQPAPEPEPDPSALRPEVDPKADRPGYLLAAHGSHLFDTARFLGGPIAAVRARRLERFGAICWFISVDFEDGALGHLDMNIPVRGDFEEGFRAFGEHGSALGRLSHPWYHKSGDVECFSARDGLYRRPLGEDAHTYKRQIEAFADVILRQSPQLGASAEDGLASVRALVAVARSCESGRRVELAGVTGGV